MKKLCVMIAACVLAVSTANTAEASLLSKRIDGVKKIANYMGKTVWNNKGAVAVGTVATVAISNPEAATAAITGGANIVTNAVTGTADVAYGVVTGGSTADTVAPRANARPSTTGNGTFSTLLFYLVIIGLVLIVVKYLLRGAVRKVLPVLVVGLLLCFVATAEASMLSSIPDIQCAAPALVKPVAHFIILVVTLASIFL